MPVLRVADIERSVDWYTRVLGFMVSWRAPNDGGGENCMLHSGESRVLLSTGSHLGDKPAFTGTLYFETEGVRDLYARIRDQVEIVWPLELMEYGTLEFGIRDPDGYTLAFAEQSGALIVAPELLRVLGVARILRQRRSIEVVRSSRRPHARGLPDGFRNQ